ncbi:heavy-metal-associated domain-containing protein [Dictyoglomus sp.]
MKKVELPISGMSCALRIENALKEVGEIADVKVNFSLRGLK